jgi:DNA-binding IclR family transcriptional regulator
VAEVARYLGLSSSSTRRFLNTFEYAGYLQRTEHHRYRLSARFVELANIYRFQQGFLWIASHPLQLLAHGTGAIVHLGQLQGRDVL